VNGFPAVPHALDILAAVALIYGVEVLAGFVGASGIASVRSAMSKAGRLSVRALPSASDFSVTKDGSLIKGVATRMSPSLSGRYLYGQGTSPAEPRMSVSTK
jgi:hypothetical protein